MGVEKVFGDRGCEEGKMEWKSFGYWDVVVLVDVFSCRFQMGYFPKQD